MNPPLIAVEIGNTTVHIGVTDGGSQGRLPRWRHTLAVETNSFQTTPIATLCGDTPCRWRVASVHRPTQHRLAEWVSAARPDDTFQVLEHSDLPLAIDVEWPERVGMDRLAAAVAVNRLRDDGRPAVIVDAGTAITVDAVNSEGVFVGGAILPGFRMTSRALAADTDLLPRVHPRFAAEPPPSIGKSTEAAIRSGIFWGGVGAIRELIVQFAYQLGQDLRVFVTGGDARLLTGLLQQEATFVPELVLAGIVWAQT
jgi:type III pantothenate kinase